MTSIFQQAAGATSQAHRALQHPSVNPFLAEARLTHQAHKKLTHHPAKLPDFSWLEVYSVNPSDNLNFRAKLGPTPLKITGGGGGWQSVQRPKKRPLTVWRGPSESYQYEIELILDGWAQDQSVEHDIRTLEVMSGVIVPGDPKPPLLILNAGGAIRFDVVHHPLARWVIPEQPDWGQAIRRERDGQTVQQFVTVKFMLFTDDDELARDKVVSNASFTTARAGDTYNKIAARALRKWGGVRWGNRLAQLNGARDGASKPELGQLVKLPSIAQIEAWKRKPRR